MDIKFTCFDESGSISLEELENLFRPNYIELNKKYDNVILTEYNELDEISIKKSLDESPIDYIYTEWDINTMLKHSPIEISKEEGDIYIDVEINREESFLLCYKHLACVDCCDCVQTEIESNSDYDDYIDYNHIDYDNIDYNHYSDYDEDNIEREIYHYDSCDDEYLCDKCEKEDYTIFYTYIRFNIISPKLNFDTILKHLKENEIDYRIIENKIHINKNKDFAFELFLILTSEFRFSKIKSAR